MKITIGAYKDSLTNPVDEQVVTGLDEARLAVQRLRPTSGIWLVQIYDTNGIQIEQQALYDTTTTIGAVNRALLKGSMKEKHNWNALAWKTPMVNGRFEYLPSHPLYNDIVEWLDTAVQAIWEEYEFDDRTIKRLRFEDSRYHVIVTTYTDTNGISYIFREEGVYEV